MLKTELLKRYDGNPIIACKDIPGALQVYNAGAVKYNDEYLLLLTVVGLNPVPEFYIARSNDGIRFKIEDKPFVVNLPEEDWICDPRITCLGGVYYILFWSGSKYGARSVLGSTKDFKTFKRHGYVSEADNRNMALFPEKIDGLYVRLDRPYGATHDGSIWISYSPDLVYWGNSRPVMDKGVMFQWEGKKIGPGAPPIRTRDGWLIIYHAVHGGYFGYYLGCALLDLKDPSKVIGRSKYPILAPRENYERHGAVPNVVFSCGVIQENDGGLKIYYAGADTCLCLATATTKDLVKACK